MTSEYLEGRCYCGALRYRLAAAPAGSMVCHCRTCRRLFAAPVVAWLSVPAALPDSAVLPWLRRRLQLATRAARRVGLAAQALNAAAR